MSQNSEKTSYSPTDGFELGFARGRIFGELEQTPLRRTVNIGSPDFCSTRNPGRVHTESDMCKGAASDSRDYSNADLKGESLVKPSLLKERCSFSRTSR